MFNNPRLSTAIEALKNGKIILLTDDNNREHEADFVTCAKFITQEQINIMLKHGSGIICVSITQQQANELELELMVESHKNSSTHRTAFTVSIDARLGITTGVSVGDRQKCIHLLAKNGVSKNEFSKPGHVFPLIAAENGTLERCGHTEGSLDLMRIANLPLTAVICEAVDRTGNMLRGNELEKFAAQMGYPMISISEIIEYRHEHDKTFV